MSKQMVYISDAKPVIKSTHKRYLILSIFVLLTAIKSFQWIFFASITNVIASFYHVDNIMVNWTAVVFMITYLTLALPISWLSERIGLRKAVIIGACGTSLGLIIKCFSCNQDGFYVAFIGHVLIGVVEPFFYSVYSQLAIVWFPDDQISMATSLCVMGDTLGMALGFIIPVSVVGEELEDIHRIQSGLFYLFLANAILCSFNTVLIVLFFDDQPKNAPGMARFRQIASKRDQQNAADGQSLKHFFRILVEFFTDRNFNLMHTSFGVNVGTGYAIHTILNQLIAGDDPQLSYSTLIVGRAGLTLLTMGLFGSIASGAALDRWHAYKSTAFVAYLLSLFSLVAFAFCLRLNEPILIYVTIGAFGFFTKGYECCGFEYAVELTYPKPEQISSTILNVSAQVYGIVVTFTSSFIVDTYGGFAGACFVCLFFATGLTASILTESRYNRQAAASK